MNKDLVLLLIRAFPITFFYPVGLLVAGGFVGALVGVLGFFVGNCRSFEFCFWSPFVSFFFAFKTWKLLLLMWGVGIFLVYGQVYRDLRG